MTSVPQGIAVVARRSRAAACHSSRELEVNPAAVRKARHWTARLLAETELARDEDLIEVAVLLVSELVTNAIDAVLRQPAAMSPVRSPVARHQVWIAIDGWTDRVRIEVHDSARALVPATGPRDEGEESGRGLKVVAALAASWGWTPEPLGKVVWCELVVNGS